MKKMLSSLKVFFFLNLILTSRPKFNQCEDRWHGALCPANLATLAMSQSLHGEGVILPTWFKNTTVFLTSGESVGQTTDNRFVCVEVMSHFWLDLSKQGSAQDKWLTMAAIEMQNWRHNRVGVKRDLAESLELGPLSWFLP